MGKKYIESSKLVDKNVLYTPAEALYLAVKTAKAKFDETIELHVRLGVDPRHADQQVRGAVVLPHGTIFFGIFFHHRLMFQDFCG